MTFIPYGRQNINEKDIQRVVDVLKSDYLTQGPAVPAFENKMSGYCQVKHAIAVNSATSALHLSCLSLGVGKGDLVWTTPITFVATANCALYCLADIDFIDIDSKTFNIDVNCLAAKLEVAKVIPKVVIVVHMCGQPCDMERIAELSQRYGFKVIEDASHAIGSRYKGGQTGNCKYSDITVFSFHPVKIITTGEGGAVVTNDDGIANKIRLLRSHGVTRDPLEMKNKSNAGWYYEQIDLGFNYRMTDIQAALGISQMDRLDEFIERRHEHVNRYSQLFNQLPVDLPWTHPDTYSSFHLYVIKLKLHLISKTHQEVFESLRERGIGVNLHYIPVYLQPYYKALGFSQGYCKQAEEYYSCAISFPLFSHLTKNEQEKVANEFKGVIAA